jgi:ankyrin repeat protein
VLNEAFGLAAFSGRLETMEYLLEHGADINGSLHLGFTAAHLAVMNQRLTTLRWLVDRGIDLSQRDGIHHGTPLGWAEHNCAGSPVHEYLREQRR